MDGLVSLPAPPWNGADETKESTGAAAIIESVSLLDAHTPQTDTGSAIQYIDTEINVWILSASQQKLIVKGKIFGLGKLF